MAVKIVECFSVRPSHGAAIEQSLPLIYFDMGWLNFPLTETLYFYNLKCSESHFLNTTVAQLKRSLSITLKHFLLLAGKIVFPLTSSTMPVFRYSASDSISLTIAVSDADFTAMTGNHARTAGEFHRLVPQMPPAVYSDDDIRFSSIAIQATFFPDHGVCIGFTHHHSICDGMSLVGFFRAWSSVNKLNTDGHLAGNALPFYNRSRVQYAAELESICWSQARPSRPTVKLTNYASTHKFRATFVVNDAQIERLKNFAVKKKAAAGRVTSFMAVCAHLWSCLVNSGEAAADDELEYFTSPVDCRARLRPPLPENFFGNCLFLMRARTTHGRLRGEEGFAEAVEAIAAAIDETVKHGRGISEFFENRRRIMSDLIGKRVVRLAGSTKMDHYGPDYGWGRAIKYECIHIDRDDGSVSVYKGRDGGVEFGLSLPKDKMEAFAAIFNKESYVNSNL